MLVLASVTARSVTEFPTVMSCLTMVSEGGRAVAVRVVPGRQTGKCLYRATPPKDVLPEQTGPASHPPQLLVHR